jgi:DNA-binding NarL/FixJ family response regulator
MHITYQPEGQIQAAFQESFAFQRTMTKIRVVLADDHAFIRIGIRNLLHKTPDIVVVGEAADGFQALSMTSEIEPDVLLLDMEMPGLNGIQVAQKLKERNTQIPILALSAHEDKHFILGMLSNGSAGYLTKEEVPEAVVKAVRGVAQGKRGWVSRKVAARIGIWMQNERPGHIHLSPKDVEMLRLLLDGKKSDEIGAVLGINSSSVEQHLKTVVQTVRESLNRF